MAKEALEPAGVARPIGTYSNAIREGRLLFIAGQVGVDADGKTVGVGDIGAQTRQALRNIGTILEAAGLSFDHVVKVTVFVTTMENLAAVQAVRKEFFKPPYPASTLVQVSRLIDPEWLIEIEAIAVAPE